MQIQVVEIKDLEDGGAQLTIDMDDEAKHLLINLGFISAIENGMARVKKLYEDNPNEHTTGVE